MADPVAKTALMLLPICTLLSTVSCDQRVNKEKRERAAQALQLFTPKFCLSLGALADYGLLSAAFIRKYDALHHDIAASEGELLHFEKDAQGVHGGLVPRVACRVSCGPSIAAWPIHHRAGSSTDQEKVRVQRWTQTNTCVGQMLGR